MEKAQWDDREDRGRPRSPRVHGCIGLRGVVAAMMNSIPWLVVPSFTHTVLQ